MVAMFIINITSVSLKNKNGITLAQKSKDLPMNQKDKNQEQVFEIIQCIINMPADIMRQNEDYFSIIL